MYKTTTRKKILSLCLLTLSQAGWAQTQTVQVLEYHPAPGQFVNVLPTAKAGTTQADINRLCEEQLEDGNLVHLGTYGGYITMKFDHPIVNKYGSDQSAQMFSPQSIFSEKCESIRAHRKRQYP